MSQENRPHDSMHEGSVVEIFGEHAPLTALSDAAMTIPYELLCAVSKRVPRVYDKGEEE